MAKTPMAPIEMKAMAPLMVAMAVVLKGGMCELAEGVGELKVRCSCFRWLYTQDQCVV